MKITSKKLAGIIRDALKDLKSPCVTTSAVCIGEINGCQIQLTVTRDHDDRMSNRKENRCVS